MLDHGHMSTGISNLIRQEKFVPEKIKQCLGFMLIYNSSHTLTVAARNALAHLSMLDKVDEGQYKLTDIKSVNINF